MLQGDAHHAAGLAEPAHPVNLHVPDERPACLHDLSRNPRIAQRFVLTLRIQNPNSFDIPLEDLSYTLEVNDAVFAEGVARPQASVPGYGEALVETAAVSDLGSLLKQLEQLPQQQSVRYRIRGRLDVGGIGGLLPFEHSGEIALPAVPAGTHSVRR